MSGTDPNPESRDRVVRRSLPNRLFRNGMRLFVVLILLAALVLALGAFTPLSGNWLDRNLKARWQEATGLGINFESADVTLATGLVRVSTPSLFDPQTRESLIHLSACEVRIDVISVLMAIVDPEASIEISRIHVHGPLDLHFVENQGRLGLSTRLERVTTIVSEKLKEKRAGEGVRVDIGSIMLTSTDFYLDRIDGEAERPLAAVQDSSFLAEFERGRSLPTHVNMVGKMVGETGSTRLSIQLSPNDEEDELGLKVRINPVDSRTDLLGKLPMDFQTGELKAGGLLRRQGPGDWLLRAETATPNVTLIGAGVHGVDHRFENALINTWIRWTNETKKLELLELKFDSRDCTLDARGELQLAEPYAYTLDLKELELRGQAVALTERTFFGENRITTPDRGRMRAVGRVTGTATQFRPESVEGEFTVHDLTLDLPNVPEPVQSVALKATISRDALRITEGQALVQGLPLFVKGEMLGRPIDGEIDSAMFEWNVAGELEGLNGLIGQNAEYSDWQIGFRGDVSGGGTIEVANLQLEHWGRILEKAKLQGRLVFDKAEVQVEQLNPLITNVSGMLEFDRNSAQLTDLSGQVENLAFELTGGIQGREVFWREGVLDAQLDARFGLDDIPRIFAWVDRKPPNLANADGQVHVTGRLHAPLEELERATLSGKVRGTEIAIRPKTRHLGETIRLPAVEAEMDAHRISLRQARGTWGDVNVEIEGSFSPQGGKATAKLDGELADFPDLIPLVGNRFDHLGGRISVGAEATVARAEGAAELLNLVEVWREAGPKEKAITAGRVEADRWRDAWTLALDGSVRLDGAELLYEVMPETSHLTEVYGTLRFNLDRCWSEEPVYLVPGVNGETSQTSVLITYPREQGKNLHLEFGLQASKVDLDDWIADWRQKPPRVKLDDPENPRAPLNFGLRVEVESDRVTYKGLEGEDLSGSLRFEAPARRQSLLVWENARAKFKQGNVLVSGRVERSGDEKIMAHDIEAEDIEVADLTQAFLKKQGMISSGTVSGKLSLEKAGRDAPGYDGRGEFQVVGSRFVSNAIFRGVGTVLKLDSLFNDLSFTRIEGDFEVEDNVVFISKSNPVVFENPSALHPFSLKASGMVGGETDTELQLALQFFPIVGNIPLVGDVWNALTGRIIRLNVQGALDNPKVSMGAPVL